MAVRLGFRGRDDDARADSDGEPGGTDLGRAIGSNMGDRGGEGASDAARRGWTGVGEGEATLAGGGGRVGLGGDEREADEIICSTAGPEIEDRGEARPPRGDELDRRRIVAVVTGEGGWQRGLTMRQQLDRLNDKARARMGQLIRRRQLHVDEDKQTAVSRSER